MSQNVQTESRADRIMTVVSGWASLVLLVLGLHRWVSAGVFDNLAKFGIIVGLGAFVMWIWGYWTPIVARLKAWKRGGGVNTAAVAIGLIVALVIVNVLVRRRFEVKFDLTKNQRYTLAPRSREIVRSLKEPVKVTFYAPTDAQNLDRTQDLLRQYADASDKFQWKYVNSLVNLTEVLSRQIKVSQDLSALRLEYGGKVQDITEYSEKDITGAILKLSQDRVRTVYFLEGHGEMSPEVAGDPRQSVNAVKSDLESVQWKTATLNLFGKDAKAPDPEEAPVIVLAGPTKPLLPQETKLLQEYLNKGGAVLLFLSPGTPDYQDLLKPWGIQTTDDLVVDQRQAQGIVVINKPESHTSVKDLTRLIFAPMRTVKPAAQMPTGVTVAELLKTGPETTTIPGYAPGKPLNEAAGANGAVTVAMLAEKTLGTGEAQKKAQIAVVGDSLFASDLLIQRFSDYNRALASGLVNYLGEEEALVSIPPKDEETEQAFLEPSQSRLLLLVHYLDFPLLALALAVIVYLKRR